jgi:hypothetical protein
VLSSGFPGELEGVLSSFSPSTKYLAIIRKTEKDQKVRHFLEVSRFKSKRKRKEGEKSTKPIPLMLDLAKDLPDRLD